jgi:hypothetical protein
MLLLQMESRFMRHTPELAKLLVFYKKASRSVCAGTDCLIPAIPHLRWGLVELGWNLRLI